MSLDLFEREIADKMSGFGGTQTIEPGAFDGFLRGTGDYAMQTFAKAGRGLSLSVAAPLSVMTTEPGVRGITGGTELSDWYFKNIHEPVFQSAVDAWTPKPMEVGAAAEIAGTLLATLPLVIASPGTAVATTGLGAAEDLVRQGVEPGKAAAVGMVQGAGLGLGIWMPVLGQNYWQRALAGGAGFNLLQGAGARAASSLILEGTPQAEAFKTFDGKAMTLDALLGLAFGSLAHLSPAHRAQGGEVWTRIRDWAMDAKPSEVAAIATLRTAQHMNEDSAPGRLAEPSDVSAHVDRVRKAIDQLAGDREVAVDDLPAPRAEPEPARWSAAQRRAEQMQKEGEALGKAYDLVLEEPLGPSNDPVVRLSPEEIGDVLVERGPAFQKRGSAEIMVGGYGLVKFIWKHGEKSTKAEQVTRDDVMRAPEVLRDYLPIADARKADGRHLREWQVERPDGKKVVYATSKFTESDGEHHLVTVFVNDSDKPRMKEKPLSEKRNRLAESPGGASKARPGDTGPDSFSSPPGGQEGGSEQSVRTEAPAGQPRGTEPPPPRGSTEGKPAGAAAAPDPLELEATRIATEQPDLRVVVGQDAEGQPLRQSAKDFLAAAEDQTRSAQVDANLIRAAAACLLGTA